MPTLPNHTEYHKAHTENEKVEKDCEKCVGHHLHLVSSHVMNIRIRTR